MKKNQQQQQPDVWAVLNALNLKIDVQANDFEKALSERDATIADLEERIVTLSAQNEALRQSQIKDEQIEAVANAIINERNYATSDDIVSVTERVNNLADITLTIQDLKPVNEAIQQLRTYDPYRDEIGDILNRLNAFTETVDGLANRADSVNESISSLTETVNIHNTMFDDLGDITGELKTVASGVIDVNSQLDDVNRRINGVIERESAVHQTCTGFDGRITEIYELVTGFDDVKAEVERTIDDVVSTAIVNLTGKVNGLVETLEREIATNADNISEMPGRIETTQNNIIDLINGHISDLKSDIDCTTDVINTVKSELIDLTGNINTSISDLDERFKSTVCSLPKNLMINSNHELVGIAGNGDIVVIGSIAATAEKEPGKQQQKKTKAQTKRDQFIKWFESQGKSVNMDPKDIAAQFDVALQTAYRWLRETKEQQ